MQLTIDAKNTTVTDTIRAYAELKLTPLLKYQEVQNQPAKATIEVHQNGDKDFSVHMGGAHASHTDKDLYAAIDIVVEKLDKQLRRLKTKRINFRQHREPLKEQFTNK